MFALSASHPAFWEEVGDPMVSSSVSLDSSAPSDTLSEEGEGPSIARLQEAVQVLIEGVGEQLGREGLRDTPKRVAKAWLDVSSGYRQDVSSVVGKAIFHEPILTQAPTGVVIVRDVEFASTSEHDLLPFYGRLHIAYIPSNGVVLGLSKVARLAKLFARRLQTQERFTRELLESFQAEVLPQGAALIVEALHLSEGPASTKRLMSACAGCFQDKRSSLMQEFLLLLRLDAPVIVDVTRHSNAGSLPAVLSLQSCASHDSDASDATGCMDGFNSPSERSKPCSCSCSDEDSELASPSGCCGASGCRDDQSRAIASSLGAGKLRSGAASAAVDESGLGRMQRAVEVILREIGEDPSRRELRGSARRYVQRLLRSTSGYRQQLPSSTSAPQFTAQPAADTHCAQSAVQLQLHFASQCEHHMLPFQGSAHIAYIPSAGSPPVSAEQVQGAVSMFSQRLQIQERLTHQLADAVQQLTGAVGTLVVCEAAHMCMVARGVEKHASSTVTLAVRGVLAEDAAARAELLQRLHRTPRMQ